MGTPFPNEILGNASGEIQRHFLLKQICPANIILVLKVVRELAGFAHLYSEGYLKDILESVLIKKNFKVLVMGLSSPWR